MMSQKQWLNVHVSDLSKAMNLKINHLFQIIEHMKITFYWKFHSIHVCSRIVVCYYHKFVSFDHCASPLNKAGNNFKQSFSFWFVSVFILARNWTLLGVKKRLDLPCLTTAHWLKNALVLWAERLLKNAAVHLGLTD